MCRVVLDGECVGLIDDKRDKLSLGSSGVWTYKKIKDFFYIKKNANLTGCWWIWLTTDVLGRFNKIKSFERNCLYCCLDS